MLQSIVQVCWATLHDVHADGQLAPSPLGASALGASIEPSTTQNPSEHTRPWNAAQSEVFEHVYWSLGWLYEQLPVTETSAMTMPMPTPSSADFMVRLRW